MARIDLKNGGYIDLASYGRIDAKGTIIGYQYIKAEYAKNSELTIKNVLAGYKQENDGTIVIKMVTKIPYKISAIPMLLVNVFTRSLSSAYI